MSLRGQSLRHRIDGTARLVGGAVRLLLIGHRLLVARQRAGIRGRRLTGAQGLRVFWEKKNLSKNHKSKVKIILLKSWEACEMADCTVVLV